jgi:hypothetical protein
MGIQMSFLPPKNIPGRGKSKSFGMTPMIVVACRSRLTTLPAI